MSTLPYRCAVIGCGWIGAKVSIDPLVEGVQSHAQAYEVCESTTLVGLCDASPAALLWVGERWPSVHRYADVDKMLACEQPEIVSICTPDDTHYRVCMQVLSAGSVKAIIIEKPIATNIADAQALIAEAKKNNIVLMVNYSRRFSESHAKIKKQIVDGQIGDIIAVTGAYSKGIVHNGSHWFDLVRWLVGEITAVEAWESLASPAGDPTCHVRVCFQSAVQGFLVGIDANRFSIFELDLIGTLGRLRIRDSGHQVEFCSVQPSDYYAGYYALGEPQFEKAGFKNVLLRLVENTVEVLSGENDSLCSGLDGLAALTISTAAQYALTEHKKITII